MRRQGRARMLVGSCSFAFYILHLIFQYLQVLLLLFLSFSGYLSPLLCYDLMTKVDWVGWGG
jgi:hypothetical protein